jgi:polysaccharide pyruvyl transferase WcaK-like protein
MKISFFSIKTQFENVGDALINREMIRLALCNGDAVVDVSRCPPEFALLLDPRGDTSGRITWIKSSEALFRRMLAERVRGNECYYYISPGGYLGERKGAQYAAGMMNTAALRMMKTIGVRIIHIGVSYERLGPWHTRLLRGRTRLIASHFTRDTESAAYARSLGLRVDDVMPDLAFGAYGNLPVSEAARTEVAFSFRTDQSPTMRSQLSELVMQLSAALPTTIPFRFVCQVERDASFLRELAAATTMRPASFHDVSANIDDCMRQYDTCTHIVSNRLHALLVGLLRGARPVPLVDAAHNQKIIGIFSSLDPSIAPIDTTSVEWVSATIDALGSGPVDSHRIADQHDALVAIGRRIYA